jgi:hypothetical protein
MMFVVKAAQSAPVRMHAFMLRAFKMKQMIETSGSFLWPKATRELVALPNSGNHRIKAEQASQPKERGLPVVMLLPRLGSWGPLIMVCAN